jgi:hypothetical protein
MAKTSPRSKKRTRASKAKLATRASKAPPRKQVPDRQEEDHIDGCDVQFLDVEATPDAELPAATGGVEIVGRKGRRGQDHRLGGSRRRGRK